MSLPQPPYFQDHPEEALFIPFFIFTVLFFIGFILSIIRYRKKGGINKLILVFLTLQGSLMGLGEIIFYFTEFGFGRIIGVTTGFVMFIFFASLIIINIKLEKRVEEKKKEIDQIRSDLVRRTSHELKTPLISLFSSTQHLLDSYNDEMSEEALKFVKIINRGGKRLKVLTDNLLDSYSIASKELKLKIERIDIKESIRNCADDLGLRIKERGIYLKEELEGRLFIDVDKVRMEQVILNLLSNAIKNTPPEGLIYLTLEQNKGFVNIIIKDTGIGITLEEKEKLFKQFGKIKRDIEAPKLDNEGSGLGLYISKEIVELHGGKIIVESEGRNKGSSFIIKLPYVPSVGSVNLNLNE